MQAAGGGGSTHQPAGRRGASVGSTHQWRAGSVETESESIALAAVRALENEHPLPGVASSTQLPRRVALPVVHPRQQARQALACSASGASPSLTHQCLHFHH